MTIRNFLALATLCLIWGSTWLVIKQGLQDLPPLTSAGIRFLVAAPLMAGVAAVLGRREGGGPPSGRLTLVLGLGNFGISFGIVYYCETVLPSGLVSVLWAVFPLLMAIGAHLWIPGERLGPRQGFGFVLGFAGVLVLFLEDISRLGPGSVPAAALLILSPTVSAVGQIYVKRHAKHTSSLLMNRNALFVGGALLFISGRVFEHDQSLVWSGRAIASVAYLAVVGTVVTFGLYFWLLRQLPANRMGLIAFITPIIAVSLGAVFGGEGLRREMIIGSLLVVLGVATAQWPVRRRAPTCYKPTSTVSGRPDQ